MSATVRYGGRNSVTFARTILEPDTPVGKPAAAKAGKTLLDTVANLQRDARLLARLAGGIVVDAERHGSLCLIRDTAARIRDTVIAMEKEC